MDGRRTPWKPLVALGGVVALLTAACGADGGGDAASGNGSGNPTTVRLGYFPNLTHAPAVVGVENGAFTERLGPDVKLETKTFNAGPEATEALFANAVDATFIGPNPAINAYAQSKGEAIRIVSGSTSGGASLVVKPEITGPADLRGKTLATPQLGNTQDVALRAWLQEEGLKSDTTGGGDVSIKPQANADTLTTFQGGQIQGAWVPEPWATRLVQEAGGKVLVDERDLWPDGHFVTTHLIVRTDFLEKHPDVVKGLVAGLVQAVEFTNANPQDAQRVVNDGIERATTKRIADGTITGAWPNLTFTWDPLAASLQKSKDDAVAVGLLKPVDLKGIYDLDLLNAVLAEQSQQQVSGL
ncbi:MAG: ABC transporter substrate-binding protein [Actinomycetota bacterium]|nr:ABC transporter substrate-binding protein [Actinomycetota bacterium]